MTWRDKLEIGLKENAPYRKDNLPPSEVSGPELPQGAGRSPEIPRARANQSPAPVTITPRATPDGSGLNRDDIV
jgi:hypothetical protein